MIALGFIVKPSTHRPAFEAASSSACDLKDELILQVTCCYTSDHARAECMWNKPRELSNGAYQGTGYEIAAWNSGSMTIYGALEQWEGSEGHLEVIINRGMWAHKKWKAIGAAVSSHYAVVWFGD